MVRILRALQDALGAALNFDGPEAMTYAAFSSKTRSTGWNFSYRCAAARRHSRNLDASAFPFLAELSKEVDASPTEPDESFLWSRRAI